MATSAGPRAETPLDRWRAGLLLAAALVAAGAGIWVYTANASWTGPVAVQFGGSGQSLTQVRAALDDARWDFALVAGYGTALVLTAVLARALYRTAEAHRVARAALPLGLVAALADVLENTALLAAGEGSVRWLLDVVTAAAVVKWVCLVPAALIAVTTVLVTAWRLARHTQARLARRTDVEVRPPYPLDGDPPVPAAKAQPVPDWVDGDNPPVEPGDANDEKAARWRRGYAVPGIAQDRPAWTEQFLARRGPTSGFCLSGGGIRSGSVALGALQTLRTELLAAEYLVSVSGGGYTAGALQLALTDATDDEHRPPGRVERDPDDAYRPGSVEEDRLRRHVRYLAASPAGLVIALGVAARTVLLSLVVLFGPAVVLGAVLGLVYRGLPIAWPEATDATSPPRIPAGTWWALLAIALLAAVAYLITLWLGFRRVRPAEGPRQLAISATSLALLVALVAVGLPWLVHLAAVVLGGGEDDPSAVRIGGPVLGVAVTYVAALASLARRKKVVERARGIFGRSKDGTTAPVAAVPGGALQLILVVVALLLLAASWLFLAAGVAARATSADAGTAFWVTVAVVAAALGLLGGLLDQTTLSLHPFYRRRLAGAFAVRRVVRDADRKVVAEPYDYGERTSLPEYGARAGRFPQVVFAAAVNLTGEQRAPLDAASFTFAGDWVGGPDIGYANTADMCRAVRPAFQADLTVQAAVAVSGAAFASAMGRASRWYSTLLAVSGLRLGTWLPNPAFLAEWSEARDHPAQWTRPGLPSIRRLTYLFREVLGTHRYQDRLLQITDGGHYENLGLVEALRRRCTVVHCIDASGDRPPTAGTLEQAITLAWNELGVRISLTGGVWDLVPGSAAPLEPDGPLAPLSARLSRRNVVGAVICYPPASDLPADLRHGVLLLGKALITPDMSYDLLSYAARNGVFPHDSTGDQFFKDEMFTAYTALGRHTGEAVARLRAEARTWLPARCPACGSTSARREVLDALRRLDRTSSTAGTAQGPSGRINGRPAVVASPTVRV